MTEKWEKEEMNERKRKTVRKNVCDVYFVCVAFERERGEGRQIVCEISR